MSTTRRLSNWWMSADGGERNRKKRKMVVYTVDRCVLGKDQRGKNKRSNVT